MVSIGSAKLSLSVLLPLLLILGMMIGTGSCAAVGDNGGKTTGLSTEIGIHENEVYYMYIYRELRYIHTEEPLYQDNPELSTPL